MSNEMDMFSNISLPQPVQYVDTVWNEPYHQFIYSLQVTGYNTNSLTFQQMSINQRHYFSHFSLEIHQQINQIKLITYVVSRSGFQAKIYSIEEEIVLLKRGKNKNNRK